MILIFSATNLEKQIWKKRVHLHEFVHIYVKYVFQLRTFLIKVVIVYFLYPGGIKIMRIFNKTGFHANFFFIFRFFVHPDA